MNDVRQEWLQKDYYAVLGVAPAAPAEEITKTYRKLARKFHPDRNPNNTRAEERFKEVSAAYDVIGDAERRKQYDEVRRLAARGGPFGGAGPAGGHSFQFTGADGLGDLLTNLFGTADGPFGARGARGPQRGPDTAAAIQLSFEDAINGAEVEVVLPDAPDGRTTRLRIAAGTADGQRIRLRGKGALGLGGGPPGDLYVTVQVGKHHLFGRDGNNLTLKVPVSFSEAAAGARISVPTFEGPPVTLRLPAGTSSGATLRVRGRGVSDDSGTGDLMVTVEIVVPEKLNAAQRRALADFEAATKGPPPRDHLGVRS